MATVIATLVCPVCKQCIWESANAAVALAHCDSLGRVCPFSGQPFGATTINARYPDGEQVGA